MDGKLSAVALTLLLCASVSYAGVSYVRWGRTTCPDGNIKLFQGYMAGHHLVSHGTGSNYLCMPDQPQFVRGKAGFEPWSSSIWGSEYQRPAGLGGQFLTDNIPGGEIHNQDMVCVRCHDPDSTDVFMMAGRQDCYKTGYTLQYKGFLVSEANWPDRQPTEYVCLDEAPEGRPGGTGQEGQSEVYPIEITCGSLPCNPYINGMEATCAVCTY